MKYRMETELKLKFSSRWGVLQNSSFVGQEDIVVNKIPKIIYDQGKLSHVLEYYIPSSSLKGSLRAAAQRISKSECTSLNNRCKDQICLICRIFGGGGASYRPSKLQFMSIYLTQKDITLARSSQVVLDRSTKSVRKGGLFFSQYLPPMEVTTQLRAVHLSEEERDFLLAALKLWGDMGIGRKHRSFKIKNLDDFEFKPMEATL